MYKIAICDDDTGYRNVIKETVELYHNITDEVVFYEYSCGETLLKHLWQQFDLVFLDIQMPGINGNETAKAFRREDQEAVLVFCTNYQVPTTESFKVQPFRYIMKDFQNRILCSEMADILLEMLKKSDIEYLNITQDGKLLRVPVKSILYITIAKRGAVIHTYPSSEQKDISCKETVKVLYEQLKKKGFEYAHNSYIINFSNIIRIEKNTVILKDKTELNISRAKKAKFEEAFSSFLCVRYGRK